jgi:hypothetical protein
MMELDAYYPRPSHEQIERLCRFYPLFADDIRARARAMDDLIPDDQMKLVPLTDEEQAELAATAAARHADLLANTPEEDD